MSEQQDANSETTQNSNNDDKKKRWELLPKIKQGLDELSNQNKNNPNKHFFPLKQLIFLILNHFLV